MPIIICGQNVAICFKFLTRRGKRNACLMCCASVAGLQRIGINTRNLKTSNCTIVFDNE